MPPPESQASHRSPTRNERLSRLLVLAVGLALLVIASYTGVGEFGFVTFDDGAYVFENPVVRDGLTGTGLWWAFTTSHAGNWHPLTWISHMVDVELFGLAPGWHHRVNVLFHLLNTLLLFAVLSSLTGAPVRSAVVAALFAVHPLHVESVAWISERKDLLSTLFALAAIGFYRRYVSKPSAARMGAVVGMMAMSLLSKPMFVTLPFLLLLFDVWPLGRLLPGDDGIRGKPKTDQLMKLVTEKIPLLLLGLAVALVTMVVQGEPDAIYPLSVLPFGARVANAAVSSMMYLVNTIRPTGLAFYYPHPWILGGGAPGWEVFVSATGLVAITGTAIHRADRYPWFVSGWGLYLVSLAPVLGLIQVGNQAMADRYTYFPLIGIFIVAVWGGAALASWVKMPAPLSLGIAATLLVSLTLLGHRQAAYWKDSAALYSHALEVNWKNEVAHVNLGNLLLDSGRLDDARGHFLAALQIRPDIPQIHNGLGLVYLRKRDPDRAIVHFREALRLRSDLPLEWFNLGVALDQMERFDEAAVAFRRSAELNPAFHEARKRLGEVVSKQGKAPPVERK